MFTHLAVADEPDDPYTAGQLRAFDAVLAGAPDGADGVVVHAANSAGALAHPAPAARFVRAGIAVYGISPGAGGRPPRRRRCARRCRCRPGCRSSSASPPASALSYGLRHTLAADATVATVPIGYADGVRRGLSGTAARC